ncbi:UDP-N-acetylglucosamine 1-carboxyvinyltransferase [Patescibacteria group bacterium]|nr:UDP-N-acetylglucosamine 1-carboxyvinyltransferase [Patescibacteria group bacterium]MBU2509085.1 UDP-N-acetylglucosamine 1-carboxyvinyltransferase [Patescibacteria group bacterium]
MNETDTQNNQRSYVVHGGNRLSGEICVPGAKNAATKQLVATLLADSPVILHNVPDIGDVHVTLEMLKDLGAHVTYNQGTVTVDARDLKTSKVEEAVHRKNRIPILLFGPLLHRFGKATIPALGGCKIGARPVGFHVEALRKMGAEIESEGGSYVARAKELKGAVIDLPFPSVGATENIMLAAVKAKGTTVIKNAAIEPEIMDLAVLLQAMGAIINMDVNRTWVIEGVESLHGAEHRIIPDRMVAASFLIAGALTRGNVFVRDAVQTDLLSFLNVLRRVGVPFQILKDGIRVLGEEIKGPLKPIALETDVHPGFMTDWQQPFVMLLTQADGVSIVHETVYEDRFGYTDALVKMGAKIQLHRECLGSKPCRYVDHDYKHSAVIVGPTPLKGADIEIPDLRAGFSYIIAALIAKGSTRLIGVEQIERGYEDIIGKLKALGADIQVS